MSRAFFLAAVAATLPGCTLVLGIEDTPVSIAPAIRAEGIVTGVDVRLRAGAIDETVTVTADGAVAFAARVPAGVDYTIDLVGAPPCVLAGPTAGVAVEDVMVDLTCPGVTRLTAWTVASITGTAPAVTADTRAYAMTVSELQQATRITAVPASAAATVTIAGVATAADAPSAPIGLTLGATAIDVVIDHPAGPILRSTYTLTITRGAEVGHAYYGKVYPAVNDQVGHGIAIDGDRIVAGAPNEASVVDPSDPTDVGAPGSGAAYVWHRTGAAWAFEGWVKAPNAEADDEFGYYAAISGDRIVVGAPFEDSGTTNMADNSASAAGAAYVYRREATGWVFEAYLKAGSIQAGAWFGWAVAIEGDTIAVGAHNTSDIAPASGAVYVFRRSGTAWLPEATLQADAATGPGDGLGYAVAIDGDTIAASAISGAISTGGSGIVRIYRRTGTTWAFEDQVEAGRPIVTGFFGVSVDLAGDVLVAGASAPITAGEPGAAYVYRCTGTAWTLERELTAGNPDPDDELGAAVAIVGDTIAVGAFREDGPGAGVDPGNRGNSADEVGAVYVYRHTTGTQWPQQRYIKPSNPTAGDWFGYALALSGDTLAIAGAGEDSGDPANPNDESTASSGAIYVLH